MGKIIAAALVSLAIAVGVILLLRFGGSPSEPISEAHVTDDQLNPAGGSRHAEVLVLESSSGAKVELVPIGVSEATPMAPASLEAYEPEFERMLGTGRKDDGPDWGYSFATMWHRQLAAQPRDPEWATKIEEQWRQYYAGKPETFIMGEPRVFCGSTMCEVRFLSNGYWPEEYSDNLILNEILTERPGAFPRPCGVASVVAQDSLNRMNAVVMILNLNFKQCNLPSVTSSKSFNY